jgi:paraquat-inducible protein B
VQDLATTLQLTLTDMRTALASADELFQRAGDDVDVLLADMHPVLENLNATLEEAEETLEAAKDQLSGDSEQAYELAATLDELTRAASTVRQFFDYLERNPEALFRGKTQ